MFLLVNAASNSSDCNSTKERTQVCVLLLSHVPVLSVQMTDVQPNVSTLANFRTIAFRPAIRRAPRLRHSVIAEGSPSGIAATPSATPTCMMHNRDQS